MNNKLLKSVNVLNETFIFAVLLSVIAGSFYVASNIYISPKDSTVLGISLPNESNSFLLNSIKSNSEYSLQFDENEYEINFDTTIRNPSSKQLILDLGDLYNTHNNPKNYRLNFLGDDAYLNDFNAYLISNDDQYDLLVDGKYYTNNIMLQQNSSSKTSMKIVFKNEVLSKFDIKLTIYK